MTGSGNGIGREISLELARSGCNVACLDLDLDAAEKLCAEMRALGVKAKAYQVSTFRKKYPNIESQLQLFAYFLFFVFFRLT